MADIDQIIAGGAGASSRADFSGLPKILDSYWAGKDQAAKNDLREAFKGGVPLTPEGQLDLPAVMKTLFQKGDIAGGVGLAGASMGAQDRAALADLDRPPPANYGPPATGRNAVAPDPSIRAPVSSAPAGTAQPSTAGQVTPSSFLESQGIQPGYNREVGLSFFKRNGIEPDQPFDPNDPKFSKMMPVMQRLKTVGQVQPPQPGDNQPQQQPQIAPPQPPQMAQAPQAAPQGFQPSPAQQAAQNDPILRRLTFLAASQDKATAAAAKVRLESYLKNQEATGPMKEARDSGLTLQQYQERQGEQAATQAGAAEMAKVRVAQYQAINEAGDKAVAEIPKLQLALKQMDDPNYYSGAFNQYNLGAKRLVAALGGDPDKAAPQEIVNKITADSILNGMGALKGLGPIRVAEMKILQQASLSPDNSIPSQKFLATMAIRVQEHAAKISDMAQNYNEGILDNGFDKKIRAMDRANPLFSPSEIERFQRIAQGKERQAPQSNQPASSPRQFSSPNDVQAAIASKQLKSGDAFLTSDGRKKYVP